jgi:lipopolysaccharide exporter
MSLANRTVRGVLWSIAGSVGGRAVGLVGSLILAAVLAPAEYGAANVAFVVVSTVNVFTTLGLGQYLVATPDAGDEDAFHATVYHVAVGWAALLLVSAFGPAIGRTFDTPGLVWLVPGMAIAVALDRVSYIPGRILARQMRFRVLGLRQVAGEVTYTAVAVALAADGFGASSIVAGNVARATVGLLVLAGSVPRRSWIAPTPLRWATTRRMLDYGIPMSIGSVLYFASSRWDNLLIARLFGAGTVGQYNLAYNLADVPAIQVGEQVGDVLLPSFTRVQDPAARVRALARATGQLALVVFPMAVGLGAIAVTLQETFLDARWSLVGSMLTLLAVLSVVRPTGWLVSSYLQARKRPRVVMGLEAIKAACVLTFIPAFGHFGPLWACTAVGVAFGTYAAASVWSVHRLDAVPLPTLLVPLVRPLLCCVPLVACVLLARVGLAASSAPAALRLALEVCAGAAGYAAAAVVVARTEVLEMRRLVTGALGLA